MEQTKSPPELTLAASAFSALGSEQRLAIVRRLVQAGPQGMPIGPLGEDVGIVGSVLTHHLKQLVSSGLVLQERNGRRILCSVDFDQVRQLSEFLMRECCSNAGAHEQEKDNG